MIVLGFGLYFEWSKSDTTEITIHVSESDDEDDVKDPDAPDYQDDGNLFKLTAIFDSYVKRHIMFQNKTKIF